MTKRSFESINYMLRPNKNVERKLIASSLMKMKGQFDVEAYRYVGFGSMWFSDFVLMHKVLGIDDMVTIESQKSRRKRVEFNRPFGCIKIKMDDAANVLSEIVEEKQAIIWLDYDGPLKNALTGDIETAIGAMSSGSMLMISVNAKVDQLRGHKRENKEIPAEEYLADICENDKYKVFGDRLTRNDFPKLVAEIVHDRLKAAALSLRPGHEYRPIWSFWYADDADMITVGGMLASEEDRKKIKASGVDDLPFVMPGDLFRIDVPVLTEKEKRALDKLLPSTTPLSTDQLDFELRPTEVAGYQQFYREYPVFGEMAV